MSQENRKKLIEDIVASLKKGLLPWRRPWSNDSFLGMPRNFKTEDRYKGINSLILMTRSGSSPFWGTGNIWTKEIGAQIRKGEKPTTVCFCKSQTDKEGFFFIKFFDVYNTFQMEAPSVATLLDGRGRHGIVKAMLGLMDTRERTSPTSLDELQRMAKRYVPKSMYPRSASSFELAEAVNEAVTETLRSYHAIAKKGNRHELAENLYASTGATFMHGGGKAQYKNDTIFMPSKVQFESMDEYYNVASHELIHWTVLGERIGPVRNPDYAFQELVAEIGSCLLNTELGVPVSEYSRNNSFSYISEWLKEIGNNPKYIFDAATLASKAVDFLLVDVGKKEACHV